MSQEIKNAMITNVRVTNEEYGALTIWVTLDYGDSKQNFGGWSLYNGKNFQNKGNYAGHFLWRLLEIAGVKNLNEVEGKTVRARVIDGDMHAIGHILKDDWFYPTEAFEKLTQK